MIERQWNNFVRDNLFLDNGLFEVMFIPGFAKIYYKIVIFTPPFELIGTQIDELNLVC